MRSIVYKPWMVMALAMAVMGWAGAGRAATDGLGDAPAIVNGGLIDEEPDVDDPNEPDEPEDPKAEREEELYEEGTEALDEEKWEEAIQAFDAASQVGGRRADGALYWKAYGLKKAGRTADALATIGELRRKAPQSRWIKEAQALEQEMKQASGQRPVPEAAADEDLKLIALQSLMHTESSRAVPLLRDFLAANRSRKLRDKALFVLSQSNSPEAVALLADIARGKSHPDLQRKAIQNLGLFGGQQSREALSDIYASSDDIAVKKAVLNAFMVSGEKGRVLALAKSEKVPELRKDAIHQLGVMGAQDELGDLYRTESDVSVKKAILHGLFIGGAADRMIELAKTETQPELRRTIVHNMGLMGSTRTAAALTSIYRTETDLTLRREVLNAFFLQGNADALIQIARAEKDPGLRREAVSKLALMGNKAATDFMLELLK
jgi:HEAT repeat protein